MKDGIIYYHGKTKDNNRFTVAGLIYPPNGKAEIGISLCSSKDNFCKRTGRIKAVGKLKSNSNKGSKIIELKDKTTIKDFVETICVPLNNLTTSEFKSSFHL